MTVELICFDMAGTTVNDHGLVLTAFRRTIDELGLSVEEARDAESYVIETMGQSKIEVFTVLFHDRAHDANEAFERHFVAAANDVGVSEVAGARAVAENAKSLGISVALTTGFSPATREVLIDLLGWNDLFSCRVSPVDAGRGRPHPDMVLLCALKAQVSAVNSIMVVGDTASDMQAGRRAGAGYCVGVLTGTDDAARLIRSGADAVLGSVAELELRDSFVA
ncbi:MAG TPA: HAD-IA family hydrolase [Acidimicrobiales bacterium]|jgi:phosphonatase-like hydrolase|nr:HAD-IA family hydrolase [Acidimicrobiales bacterium]